MERKIERKMWCNLFTFRPQKIVRRYYDTDYDMMETVDKTEAVSEYKRNGEYRGRERAPDLRL
jgi:hypothetical protein